jgi:hypothetical protein
VRFTIYEIERCGFYQRGEAKPLFGNLGEWWESFVAWVSKRDIKDTKTAQSTELTSDETDILSVYCVNAFSAVGNTGLGLVLWNEVPHTTKGVLSIPGSKKVGGASANIIPVNEDEIPGWPSHFWLCPKENYIVTLNPEARATTSTGIKHFEEYFSNFLKYWSQYCVTISKDESVEEIGLSGWRKNKDSGLFIYPPSFKIRRIKLPGELDIIRGKRSEIYKYVSHVFLDYKQETHHNFWQKFWSMRNQRSPVISQNDKIQFNVETSWEPTLEELETAIGYAQENPFEQSGVKIHNHSSILWFNKIWASSNFDLSDGLDNVPQWNSAQLEEVWRKIQPLVFEMFSKKQL